jgi:hypothetical protein
MDVKTRVVDLVGMIFQEGEEAADIDLSARPASPCNVCLVSIMCKSLCPAVTDYLFDYETYDTALERTLIQCATDRSMIMDIFELKSRRKGLYKNWIIRTYRGRIQSFIERE